MAYRESYAGKINRKLNKKLHVVEVASGRQKADLVLKNATYVNVFCNELSHGDIAVAEGLIAGMGEHYEGAVEVDMGGKLVLPGFVDAHIHLESALVSPKEFANAVIPHGTTTVITDPHEIANVMGTDGIEYMLQATEDLPVDVRFMLPSCVPATPLDESGAVLDYRAIDSFYEHNRVEGLAEMMNYVGVANADEQVLEKIVAAQAHHKKIDGHAPGLSGNDLNAYIAAGVYSDHECSTVEDAIAKLERGQYIMIREGTAARNLDALLPLLTPQYYTYCMFCTDDKHPNDLLEKGHIDYIIKKLTSHVGSKRGAELSIAALVSMVNICTANNTVAILTVGNIAKKIGDKFGVDNRKAASILDTFSCTVQGLIPYGVQMLLAAGLSGLNPLDIIPYLYYPIAIGVAALLAVLLRYPKRYS